MYSKVSLPGGELASIYQLSFEQTCTNTVQTEVWNVSQQFSRPNLVQSNRYSDGELSFEVDQNRSR